MLLLVGRHDVRSGTFRLSGPGRIRRQKLEPKPLSVAPGVVEAASDHIRTLTARIRLVNQQLKAAHRKLDELCAQLIPSEDDEPGQLCEQRDVVILRSMPGLGRIILAVLIAEDWQPLRRRDYHALRILSGGAPVTRRSGKTCVVVRRYARNKRLENALYHWARVPARPSQPWTLCRTAPARPQPRPRFAHRCRPLAVGGLHSARPADAVRPHLQGSGRRVASGFYPFVRSKNDPSLRPDLASWQSAAHSGRQGCRRERGGTGGAGARCP